MRNKTLSIMISLFLILSGLYFDKLEMESFFACIPTETSDFDIVYVGNTIADVQACNTEKTSFKEIGNTYQARNSIIFHDFVFTNIFSLFEGGFCLSFDEIHIVSQNQNKSVISYIHNIDGKK